jgi:hypothetical protein
MHGARTVVIMHHQVFVLRGGINIKARKVGENGIEEMKCKRDLLSRLARGLLMRVDATTVREPSLGYTNLGSSGTCMGL